MRPTHNTIAEAIFEKHGHRVELVRGTDYFYFVSDEADYRLAPITYAYTASVETNWLWSRDVDQWVSEYESLIEGVEVPENAANDTMTLFIKFARREL